MISGANLEISFTIFGLDGGQLYHNAFWGLYLKTQDIISSVYML